MTHEQIKAFYIALGDLCLKHGIDGVAGIWFGKGEEMGDLTFFNPANTQMKLVCQGVSEKFRQFTESSGVKRGPALGSIHEVATPPAEKN